MNEQTKTEPHKAVSEEEPQIESAQVTDEDLENVAGGGVGGNAVVSGGGGYSAAKP